MKCLNHKNVIILRNTNVLLFLTCILTKNFLREIMFKEPYKKVAFNIGRIGEDL